MELYTIIFRVHNIISQDVYCEIPETLLQEHVIKKKGVLTV